VRPGSRHWFEHGQFPRFTALAFFNNPAGWEWPNFTGDPIAERFPAASA